MRFIITAQASADTPPTDPAADFDAELFKAYMRFNEEMHQAGVGDLPQDILRLINEAAPSWSASAWQSRNDKP
mgnify:CR=1 FL=1